MMGLYCKSMIPRQRKPKCSRILPHPSLSGTILSRQVDNTACTNHRQRFQWTPVYILRVCTIATLDCIHLRITFMDTDWLSVTELTCVQHLSEPLAAQHVTFHRDAYSACQDAHAIAILTEWDEFTDLDYEKIYAGMNKPAFCFDGRNIIDHQNLRDIGFIVYGLGKPLDAFIKKSYSWEPELRCRSCWPQCPTVNPVTFSYNTSDYECQRWYVISYWIYLPRIAEYIIFKTQKAASSFWELQRRELATLFGQMILWFLHCY